MAGLGLITPQLAVPSAHPGQAQPYNPVDAMAFSPRWAHAGDRHLGRAVSLLNTTDAAQPRHLGCRSRDTACP
jgi:hypothetical protein